MLQKIDVSTQITGLRPKIKQAIVHLAHHLSKEIQKCEKRKGKMADKFRRKAETFRKEVVMLRDIDPDAVSRYALMMDFSEREKLLGDINLPLDSKVKVKLSTFKPVVSHVENFRATHSSWKIDLPELLESLGKSSNKKKEKQKQKEESIDKHQKKKALKKISKTENADSSPQAVEKKKENNNAQIQKNSTVKKPLKPKGKVSEDIIDEDGNEGNTTDEDECGGLYVRANVKDEGRDDTEGESSDEDDDNDEEENDDGDGSGEEEEDEDEDENDNEDGNEDEEEVDTEGENECSSGESLHEENISKIGLVKGRKSGVNPTLLKNKSTPRISSASKFAEVRRFADLHLEDGEQQNERKPQDLPQQSDKNSENESSDNECGEEDTFFMTGENKFLKTVAVKRDNGEGLGLDSEKSTCPFPNLWATDGKQLKGNRAQRRAKFLNRPLDKRHLKKLNNKNDSMSNKFVHNNGDRFNRSNPNSDGSSVKKNFRGNGFSSSRLEQSDPAEKLHPSWEAKRKQKISLNNFQGKKIKFGDDNAVARGTGFPKNKQNLSNTIQSDPGEKLHPSWEAKRKQKISFDNFQGKKVKFDDD